MRILLVNHLLDPVTGGGTAERTYQIGRHLARTGVDCTILALDIGITDERRVGLEGAKLVTVPCRNARFFVPSLSASQVRSLVAKADIVHLSGHWTLLNALVFRACRQLGKPYLFCPAGALRPFGRSLWLKRLYDVAVGKSIVDHASACVAITADERADFLARGVNAARISVIPNGIDPKQYAVADVETEIALFRQRAGIHSAPYILFLGRLNEIKGPDLLLDAYRNVAPEVPDVHLVFAGPDGGMRNSLIDIAEASGLSSRVHFVGFLGGDAKAAALRGARLLVIPSRREAMSIVVLEAGACGCPVLFTDTCGLDRISLLGAGMMVSPDAAALTHGLLQMLGDPVELAASARRLAALVEAEYPWSAQAARYVELCNTIVGSASA